MCKMTFGVRVLSIVNTILLGSSNHTSTLVLGLVAATIVLGEGYFFFEWATLGVAVAWTDLPFNLLQGTVCAAVAFPLTKIVGKLHLFDEPQTATADDWQPDSQNKE